MLGQIGYDDCPSVPPELVLAPSRWGFSLSAMSAWTRTIVVPLSIMSAFQPVRRLDPEQGIAELFREDLPRHPARRTRQPVSWTNIFLGLDRLLKWADRHLPRSWREPGIRAAHRWIIEHFENSDGLGAIFPPMIYTVIALHCLGYAPDSAPVQWAWRQLEDLLIEEDGKVRVQPCVSPVWDTAIATIALADARLPDFHPALLGAVRWLLSKEVRAPGDGQVRRPGVEPAGWHFQFHNEFYPDVDDTAMVLLALQRTALADSPEAKAATGRGVNWLLAMQNSDGGWAAFDVDVNNEVLTKVPFADHNAMLDPSCADITARVLEILGRSATAPTIRRSPGRSTTSGGPSNREGAGTAAGGSTTSTGPGRSSRGSRRSTSRWTTPRSRWRLTGSSRSSRPTAAGASRAGATTTRSGWAGASRPPRRRPGPSSA